jgi:hypothetical protein
MSLRGSLWSVDWECLSCRMSGLVQEPDWDSLTSDERSSRLAIVEADHAATTRCNGRVTSVVASGPHRAAGPGFRFFKRRIFEKV